MSSEEFTKITYKRKSRKQQTSITSQIADLSISPDDFDFNKSIKRVLDAKDDILTSDYYLNVQASVREALSLLNFTLSTKQPISEIVCFGIGHISDCMIPRYQLALILLIKDKYEIDHIKISDPILSENDHNVLEHFDINIIKNNIEAKYVIKNNNKLKNCTLFFLPHCPKQLSNNLLWANWSLSLENCIIFSNSFLSLIDNCTKRELIENAEYVLKISPFVKEIAVINSFKFYEIFNDSALHVFPNLGLISQDIWLDAREPKYIKDIEYIEA